MELNEALGRISEIRSRIAEMETFRGYRSLTVGFSALLGVVAACLQARWIPDPGLQVWDYVDLWVGVAVISVLAVGGELTYRWSISRSPLKRRLTVLAVQQFAPCLVAGAAVTVVVPTYAPEVTWMLPGLWAILFSLGIFASCRLLPQPTTWVGIHYLLSGSICLAIGNGPLALSPWLMIGTFGVGQLLSAGILYFTLERRHGRLEA